MALSFRRVVVAGGAPLMRQVLRIALSKRGFMVVAEAEDRSEAMLLTRAERPDVVILIADDDEFTSAVPALLETGAKVLAIGRDLSPKSARALLALGASGYLTAQVSLDELAKALADITAGGAILDPMVAAMVVQEWAASSVPGPRSAAWPPAMSSREREILRLLADGLSTKEIAGRLCISDKTVENHKTRLFRALGVRTQGQAVAVALEAGILENDREGQE